jgi:hypothetical protein
VRDWATKEMTSRDTRQIGITLADRDAGEKVLREFREYFRAGVDSALQTRS